MILDQLLMLSLSLALGSCSLLLDPLTAVQTHADADVDADAVGDGDSDEGGDADTALPCVDESNDEDGDGVYDACDSCPTVSNRDQADSDGDGLGDACEWPDHYEMLSAIRFFDPFTRGDLSAYEPADNWETSDSAIIGYIADGDIDSELIYVDLLVTPPFSVETSVISEGDHVENRSGILFSVRMEHDHLWWYCSYNYNSHQIEVWRNSGSPDYGIIALESTGASAPTGELRRIRVDFDTDLGLTCSVENQAGERAQTDVRHSDFWPDMAGRVGFRVVQARQHYQYLLIYQ